ncbi:hypothetical protein CEXT_367731 [Caerostris extrusa]|uniref:Uncharacterized protein n=1 Tax=Caerostris extrusa TaxID=172846 RepID=A0AAV4RCK8_CAEEX|nr:hypothetical protein CEXT_367731 [Caerostris extrusa]
MSQVDGEASQTIKSTFRFGDLPFLGGKDSTPAEPIDPAQESHMGMEQMAGKSRYRTLHRIYPTLHPASPLRRDFYLISGSTLKLKRLLRSNGGANGSIHCAGEIKIILCGEDATDKKSCRYRFI